MRGKLSLQTQLGLILVLVIVPGMVPSVRAAQSPGSVKKAQKGKLSAEERNRLISKLFEAIQSNNLERVKGLVGQGADVNFRIPPQSRSLLHLATVNGNDQAIMLLLEHGAVIDARDKNGWTPLHIATGAGFPRRKRNPDTIRLLLNCGANVNVSDNYGLTPLHLASAEGHIDIVKILLECGADVNAKDNSGRTAMHYAAEANYTGSSPQRWSVNMLSLLVDAGADINIQDYMGWTPLHYAARQFKQYLIEALVESGAKIDLVDKRGRTPFMVMQERVMHLRAFRGTAYETSIPRDLRNDVREASRFLYRNGRTYVVATNGKDTNPGTLKEPLRTITTAIDVVMPGDRVLVREGTYVCSRTIQIDKSGVEGNPIRLAAYPGAVPVLDFSEVKGESIALSGAYWHIKGLTITCATHAIMIHSDGAHHNVLEQMSAFDCQEAGICITADGPAYNIILNCDSFRNFGPATNGDGGDGFFAVWNVGPGNILIGNRAWNNSDDGYDLWYSNEAVRLERCYSWRNGENIWDHPFFRGNGNGFKLGQGGGRHVLIDCTAWGHKWGAGAGFTLNGNSSGVILRNCSAWGNRTNYEFASDYWESIGGAQEDCVFMNNISLDGERKDAVDREAISQSNNWDSVTGAQLTDDDFLSLDDSRMSAPRNPDGSIPQNDFLKLAPGSTAIDKGLDLGIPFVGAGPDLGAFEYDPNETSEGYVKMLHQAVRDHDVEEINNVLTAGAGINDKDWLGYTPLHWAVYFGYPDLIELLISKGADPDIQSNTGRYALEIARAMAYPELEALLRRHGAKAGDVTHSESSQAVGQSIDQ